MNSLFVPFLVFGIVFGAAGAHLLWSSLQMLTFARASVDWPSVEGRVVRLGVHPGSAARNDSFGVVTYTYAVGGVWYESNVHDFCGRSSRNRGGDVLAAHHVGESVNVYYDPDLPSRATLHRGAAPANYVAVAFGSVLALVGLVGMLGTVI